MAKAIVKCLYCGEQFDRNSKDIEFIKIKTRYAHKSCADAKVQALSKEELDKKELMDYIKQLYGTTANWARIQQQLKQMMSDTERHYTYSGIRKTLVYWYEIKKQDVSKSMGAIGIVPHIYQQALDYYYALYLAQLANENKDIQNYNRKVITFEINIPQREVKPIKLFDMEDDDE